MAREPRTETPDVEELTAQIATLKADLARLADTVKGQGEGLAEEVAARARRAYDHVRDEAAQRAGQVRERAEGYLETADTAVKTHPATAMGLAVGAGFLLGLILARR
ncbi:MAG: DUF883 domain-containing protein [Rhodobacteraceae bacterium]|nr:DUF883 domain-containing protein [Paracoccaceae bacterium]